MIQRQTQTQRHHHRSPLRLVKPGRELLARLGAGVALIGAVLGFGAKRASAETILDTLTGTTLLTNTASGISSGLGGTSYRIPLSSMLTNHDCRITNLETVFAITSSRTPDQLGSINFYFGALTAWQSTDPSIVQAETYSAGLNLAGYDYLSGAGTSASPAKYRLRLTTNDPNFTAVGGVTYMGGFSVGLNNGDVGQAAILETSLTPAPPTVHARVLRTAGGANQFGFYGEGTLAGFPALYNGVMFSGQDVASTSAPEPGTLVLAGLGAGALIARRRRR